MCVIMLMKGEIFMWTKQKSIFTSIIMTVALFFIIIIATVFLPGIIEIYLGIDRSIDYKDFMLALYVSVVPGLICTVCLMKLLLNIKKDNIFIKQNVMLLRGLSWCCFFVCAEYILIGHEYIAMLLLAFAAFFFGLILRVIKNVFDKAIQIREENDYTI